MPKNAKKEQKPLHNEEPTTTHTQLIEILYIAQQRFIPLLTLNEIANERYGAASISTLSQSVAGRFIDRLKNGEFDFNPKKEINNGKD